MKNTRSRKAEEVLPAEMIKTIRAMGLGGMYIYISTGKTEKVIQRCKFVGYLHYEEGLSTKAIALRLGLTERRIFQLLQAFRERYPNHV